MSHLQEFLKKHSFLVVLFCLTGSYCVLQIFQTYYATLCVDDFWFSHWIYRYKSGLPYLDFSPNKTVLGYYLLLIPFALTDHFAHFILEPLYFTKHFITLFNSLIFAITAVWLRKYFSQVAVLASFGLILFSEYVISYSTNIRVDIFAYYVGFCSILALLDKKYILSGLLMGLAFLFSQKAIWFIASCDVSLIICWLICSRQKDTFLQIFSFNCSLLAPIISYILFWSWQAGLLTVLHNIFSDAYIIYSANTYDSTRYLFWRLTLLQNPFPFLFWPFTLISILAKDKNDSFYQIRVFAIIYATCIMFCLIHNHQIFSYYMVATIPAFLLLYAVFFDWLIKFIKKPDGQMILEKKIYWIFISLYLLFFWYISIKFTLPNIYFLICLIPMGIGILTLNKMFFKIIPIFLIIIFIYTAFVFPLSRLSYVLPVKNAYYQKSMLKLIQALSADKSDYLAGIDLIYNKNQPIPGLQQLDAVQLAYLYHPQDQLKHIMLNSLDHAAITQQQAIESLKNTRLKFYVTDYRIVGLPPLIRNYLAAQYEHFWGSIYIYSPTMGSGKYQEKIKFSGKYCVESTLPLFIDNIKVPPLGTVDLTAGPHRFSCLVSFRLKLLPQDVEKLLDKNCQKDQWFQLV